jgi:hypothetical protein
MLSENIETLRDQLARYEEDGVVLTPEAVETFTRMLTAMRADAVALESGILAKTPLPATLRLAEKLTRQGVQRGAGEQPLLSRHLQKLAERIAGHFNLGDCFVLKQQADGLVAKLNELSAWAWALEEKAAGGADAAAIEIPIAVGEGKVVDIASARRERST